jgi:hypothetical protein
MRSLKSRKLKDQLLKHKQKHEVHREIARKARLKLERNMKVIYWQEKVIFTYNMQKFIILPILFSNKESHLISCLVFLNETFIPAKRRYSQKLASLPAYCIVLQEGNNRRTADTYASAHHAVIDE